MLFLHNANGPSVLFEAEEGNKIVLNELGSYSPTDQMGKLLCT